LPTAGDAHSIGIPCLRALIRGLTDGSREDLAGLARELNGILYLLGPQGLCAPWFYARIDTVRRKLQYVNAGHEPPLLIRRDGAIERLERTGAGLGLWTRGVHRQAAIAIEPGDLLAIFSQGLSEETVLDTIREHRHSGTAELTRRVWEESPRSVEDRTFAAVRVVDACRHPLADECTAENLVLCAA
jgi:serine phosphatase RsbU (regulator of sigma subunit)